MVTERQTSKLITHLLALGTDCPIPEHYRVTFVLLTSIYHPETSHKVEGLFV
jgi:hypothetical protein